MSATPPASGARHTGPVLAVVTSLLLISCSSVVPLLFGVTASVAGDLKTIALPLLGFAVTWVLLALWVRRYERRPFASIGLEGRGAGRGIGLGVVLALVLLAISLLPLLAGGVLRFESGAFSAGAVALLLLGFVIQGGAEEVVFRGFLQQALRARWSLTVAVVVQTIVFMVPHVANPGISPLGIVNVLLAGLMFGYLAAATGSLWAPIALHAVWNWAQPAIFGFNVSGVAMTGWSALLPRFGSDVPTTISGGENGVEGMVTASLALLLVTIWAARTAARRARRQPA